MKATFWAFLAIGLPFFASSYRYGACNSREFNEFKYTHNKVYENAHMESLRCAIFTKNLAEIESHNAMVASSDAVTHTKGVNQFTDLTLDEFMDLTTGIPQLPNDRPYYVGQVSSNIKPIPEDEELDLRTSNISIKNQKSCGSCWAFSATGIFEYWLYKYYNIYYKLGEQMSVDCARQHGCSGGWMKNSLNYFLQKGADFETAYPYVAEEHQCAYKDPSQANIGINHGLARKWHYGSHDENELAHQLKAHGWMSVCLNAAVLHTYNEGVIRSSHCSKNPPTHAVILVGYGTENGVPYWLIRNSWGEKWGMDGYFKLERNQNACDIANPYEEYRIYLE